MDELFNRSLSEIALLFRARAVSPVELTEALLQRIETLDHTLNAFVRVTADRAMAEARLAESEIAQGKYRGPLHGIPIALKDIIDTAGIETAAGTKVMAGRIPTQDATVAARLDAAGTILLGKLALTEGALSEHRPERPEPRNPWSRDHWTGVSSSGSGVAIAAGLALGTLGTDTGGSIRFPSAACGVTGLKPSWGRVSRHGVFPLAASLDHVGPMARSAADCAILFDAIAGPDPLDPTSRTVPPLPHAQFDPSATRIGIDPHILATVHPLVAAAVARAAALFEDLGCNIRDIALPALEPFANGWSVTTGVEAAIAHADLYDAAPQSYGPALKSIIELGRNVPAHLYAGLQQLRLAFAGQMARIHQSVELVLLPVLPMPVPTLRALAEGAGDPEMIASILRFTAAFNYGGQPSLTLPVGIDEDGLPIGMQLIGPVMSEARLLAAGAAFQAATDWHQRRPALNRVAHAEPPLAVL